MERSGCLSIDLGYEHTEQCSTEGPSHLLHVPSSLLVKGTHQMHLKKNHHLFVFI